MNIIKEIINVWKGKSFIDSVMTDFKGMMREIERMFEVVTILLFQHKSIKGIEDKIHKEDIFVNKSERKIRKRIVEHLTIQPKIDLGASLVMMSIVKDAERIGDYCKNLYEVYKMFKKFNSKHKYYNEFKSMRDKLAELIKETDRAFRESLEDRARYVIDEAYKITKRCDALVEEFAFSNDITVNDAVCLTLLARYFKRIAAHLSNISTAVLYPVHHIDFVYDKLKK
jgi:phosphate uptake regulator